MSTVDIEPDPVGNGFQPGAKLALLQLLIGFQTPKDGDQGFLNDIFCLFRGSLPVKAPTIDQAAIFGNKNRPGIGFLAILQQAVKKAEIG